MLLIGSVGLRTIRPDLISHIPRDMDFIGGYDEVINYITKERGHQVYYPFQEGKKIYSRVNHHTDNSTIHFEYEIAWPGTTARELVKLVDSDPATHHHYRYQIPSLDVLYTIKMSHRFLRNSPHFLKTMADIQVMRKAGAVIPERYQEWFKAREKETYNYKHPNLNQSKKNFFDASVTYVYDHDSIHRAVAVQDKPAYEYFKDDLAEVKVSKTKWDALPLTTKLNSVYEETLVLALERSQVPYKGVADPFQSFRMALMKVCTSITSGWWREFAWEHYDAVVNMYNPDYVDNFWKAVEEGKVIKL